MSKIEWTDKTWNPIIGCSKTSPACDHCYAERMAFRHSHNPKAPIEYKNVVTDSGTWNGQTAFVKSVLEKPLHWRKPCRVFVGSMTDLFHPSTPFEWIDKIINIMAQTPHLTYQILTKRPERMYDYITHNMWLTNDPMEHVWFGVTVENQDQAEARIPFLLDTPAAVRFVSIEPMLGPVDLKHVTLDLGPRYELDWLDALRGMRGTGSILHTATEKLDWVICGGETGPGARPMWEPWARDLMEQCKTAGVPFFFKKWGSYKGPDDWRIPGGETLGGEIVREFPTTHGG